MHDGKDLITCEFDDPSPFSKIADDRIFQILNQELAEIIDFRAIHASDLAPQIYACKGEPVRV